MGTANLSTLSAILKDLYLGPVREQLNNEVFLFQRLTTNTEMLVGNQAVVPLHRTRASGIGVRPEDFDLPVPTNQGFSKATYDIRAFYGAVRVTGLAMAKTKSQAGSFLEALKSELDGIRTDLKRDLARQIYGDGTGSIAVGASISTNVITLAAAAQEAIVKGWLYPGMTVDVVTTSTGAIVANGGGRTILAVTAATPSITIDASGTYPAVDGTTSIVRAGATGQTARGELNGLAALLPTAAATLGGILPTGTSSDGYSLSWWDNLRTNVNGALSQDIMQQAWSQCRRSGETPSLLLTSLGIRRQYFNLLQSQVRYTEPTKLAGGFEALDFNGQPLVADIDANFGKIYYLNEKHIQVYQTEDWHFLDQDGSSFKWAQNRDAWLAYLARYMQIGMDRRNSSLVAYGITGDTTGY